MKLTRPCRPSESIRREVDKLLAEFAAGSLPPDRDQLDAFTRSYIEALLTTAGDSNQPEEGSDQEPVDFSVENLAPGTLKQIVADCRKFQEENAEAIAVGCTRGGGQWSDDELAGTDFALTRNREGAGFWDGDWPEPQAKQLTDAAHAFGEASLYAGDDGLIYQMGEEGDWRLKKFTSPNASGGLIDQVTVRDRPEPADPAEPEGDDDERLESSARDLVDRLLAEDELEGGPEDEDIICPTCDAMQPASQCTLGGLGNRVHYRCRQCGGDWSASKCGPAWGDSPGDC